MLCCSKSDLKKALDHLPGHLFEMPNLTPNTLGTYERDVLNFGRPSQALRLIRVATHELH